MAVATAGSVPTVAPKGDDPHVDGAEAELQLEDLTVVHSVELTASAKNLRSPIAHLVDSAVVATKTQAGKRESLRPSSGSGRVAR